MTSADLNKPGFRSGFFAVVKRDLLLAFRRRQDLANPIIFFVIVISLFPLGVSPDKAFLATVASGVVWVAALLATILSLDSMFRTDYEDGSLEQMLLSSQPLFILVLGKILAHWLVTGIPLILLSPVLALMLHIEQSVLGIMILTLLIGTPVLSLIGAIGAALTVSLRVGGVLISLLILPLYIPVLIFGTGVVKAAEAGMPYEAYLSIQGAMLMLALVLAPFAAVAALKISVSN